MTPNRIPDSPTELANGLTIPAIKPFTCRKLARPILEDPSTRKTISAACTLSHLPVNTKRWRIHVSTWTDTHLGRTLWWRIRIIDTLRFTPIHGGQQDSHSEKPAPHLHNLGTRRAEQHLIMAQTHLTHNKTVWFHTAFNDDSVKIDPLIQYSCWQTLKGLVFLVLLFVSLRL